MKFWLKYNSIEMYSAHNEGKSVVVEKLIRTFKNKIHKHMTSISKDVHVDKLGEILNKYNNISIIAQKSVDGKNDRYIDSGIKSYDKDLKFKVGNHVRISKYKSIFAKGYTPNWSEEFFAITKVKSAVPCY